jgi:hypothetical protein
MIAPTIPLPSRLPRMTSALWVAFVTVTAIAIGVGSAAAPLFVSLAAGGCVVVAVLWGRPRVALTAWILSITMVPNWIGATLATYVPISSVIAVIVLIVTIGKWRYKPTKWDLYFGMFLLVSLVAVVLGGSSQGLWAEFVVSWGLSFLVARVLISGTGTTFAINTVAVIFALVGGLALLELLLVWHPFIGWIMNNSEYERWGNIQTREGADRSVWAFGHPIALGAALALSIPFVLRSTYARTVRALMLVFVFSGILATASRGPLLAGLFTLALCGISAVRNSAARAATIVLAYLVVLFVMPYVQTFAAGKTTEERDSAQFRTRIYATLPQEIPLFGRSRIVSLTDEGVRINGLESVDSTLLAFGLNFGWILLVMLIIPLAFCALRIITGRASIAEIAVVGQIPLLWAVAMITQWKSFLFFVIGFALVMAIEAKARDPAQVSPVARALAISNGSATEGHWRTRSAASGSLSSRINRREDLL